MWDGEALWDCENSKKINHNYVFALCNDCYFNDVDETDKTSIRRATTVEKGHDVTVCIHTSGLEANTYKLVFSRNF